MFSTYDQPADEVSMKTLHNLKVDNRTSEDSGISSGNSINESDSAADITIVKRPSLFECSDGPKSDEKKLPLSVQQPTRTFSRRRYACDMCDKSYSSKTYVKLHKTTSCSGLAPVLVQERVKKTKKHGQQLFCDICGKKFRKKKTFRYKPSFSMPYYSK